MISKSEKHNPNYLAKIVQIKELSKHPNADRLQLTQIDFQTVILGEDAKVGDWYVFFPIESCIAEKLLSYTNSFREKLHNNNKEISGFFEDKGRVKAVKLRGIPSNGYCIPIREVQECYRLAELPPEGAEFDMIGDEQIVKKYVVYTKPQKENSKLHGKQPKRISRLVEGQVHLHVDTEQLKRNMFMLNLDNLISITNKLHGTSFWVSNVLVKRKLSLLERILNKFSVQVKDMEYDIVYGSRKVVKNEFETKDKQHFYNYDLWGDIKDRIKHNIPKGFTLYGECVGYTKDGGWIQKDYDYGCTIGENKIFIYRITFTNEDGIVTELSTLDMIDFCAKRDLRYVPLYFTGTVYEFLTGKKYREQLTMDKEEIDDRWHSEFINKVEDLYIGGNTDLCSHTVPDEGVVIRIENLNEFKALKLKSFEFLEFESAQLDLGNEDLESTQSESYDEFEKVDAMIDEVKLES